MKPAADEMAQDLRGFLELYREFLRVVEKENSALRQSGDADPIGPGTAARRELLPRLDESLEQLRRHRAAWSRVPAEERARHPEIATLLRQCQDAVLKIVLLDRENEQALLRRGLLSPRDLPAHQRQRPNFVASLYRRQGGS